MSARSDGEITTLHIAAAHSGSEVVRLLLERGADVAARDNLMNTPLHSATSEGYSVPYYGLADIGPDPEVVGLLLENGTEVDARNAEGNTPLHLAVMPSQHWQDPWSLEVINLLLNAGADITATNDDDLTACGVGPSDEMSIRDIICRWHVSPSHYPPA